MIRIVIATLITNAVIRVRLVIPEQTFKCGDRHEGELQIAFIILQATWHVTRHRIEIRQPAVLTVKLLSKFEDRHTTLVEYRLALVQSLND